jgi:hypothetical protein
MAPSSVHGVIKSVGTDAAFGRYYDRVISIGFRMAEKDDFALVVLLAILDPRVFVRCDAAAGVSSNLLLVNRVSSRSDHSSKHSDMNFLRNRIGLANTYRGGLLITTVILICGYSTPWLLKLVAKRLGRIAE